MACSKAPMSAARAARCLLVGLLVLMVCGMIGVEIRTLDGWLIRFLCTGKGVHEGDEVMRMFDKMETLVQTGKTHTVLEGHSADLDGESDCG